MEKKGFRFVLAAVFALGLAGFVTCENAVTDTIVGGGKTPKELGEADYIDGESDGYQGVKVNSLTLDKTTATLSEAGATVQLTATVNPPDAEVRWMSENGAIASVSPLGLVTAVKGGEIQIIAKAGGQRAVCTVTVNIVRAAGLYEGEGDAKDLAAYEGAGSLLEKSLAWIKDNGTDNGEYTILLDNEENNKTTDGYVNNTTNGYVIGMFDSSNGNNSSTGNKKSVTITLQSAGEDIEIKKTGQGALFTVCGNNSTDVPELVLGNGITLKGYTSNNKALVVVGSTTANRTGKLTMLEGSQITGNSNSTAAGGGGVNIGSNANETNPSIFIMEGGTIDYNHGTAATGKGGGVIVGGSIFEMKGGNISNNDVGSGNGAAQGGGVWVSATGTLTKFTLSGNGTIENNKTLGNTTAGGGGVYSGRPFEMKGGFIQNNEASQGGGVYLAASTSFQMTGGTIAGNKASQNGAACFILSTFAKSNNSTIYGTNADTNSNCKTGETAEETSTIHAIQINTNTSTLKYYYDGNADSSVNLDSTKADNWSTP
jgi:hypothetical protein